MLEENSPWFVYVLRCSDGSYYTGVAADVIHRLKQHNAGQAVAFTKERRPVELVYFEKCDTYLTARQREKQLIRMGSGKERIADRWVSFDSPRLKTGLAQDLSANPSLSGYLERIPLSGMSRESKVKKNPWYVYILRCSDGSFYTGITKNIEERLKTHNAGNGAKYTRWRRPVNLVYRERQANQSSAMKRERQIKKLERRNKEKLVLDFPRFSAASSGIKKPRARKLR